MWLTFQRRVEHEAAEAHEEVAPVGDDEDGVVAVLAAGFHTLVGQPDEHEVGERVDDFSRVVGEIIVFFTPLQRRGYRVPESGLVRCWVGDGREP